MIVEHASSKYNLYLSDITGVYFALSLEDLVVTEQGIDLELVSNLTFKFHLPKSLGVIV